VLETINHNQELKTTQGKKPNRKLDTMGWGLFVIGWGLPCRSGGAVAFPDVGSLIPGALGAGKKLSGSARP
jgi:hypothetical protein